MVPVSAMATAQAVTTPSSRSSSAAVRPSSATAPGRSQGRPGGTTIRRAPRAASASARVAGSVVAGCSGGPRPCSRPAGPPSRSSRPAGPARRRAGSPAASPAPPAGPPAPAGSGQHHVRALTAALRARSIRPPPPGRRHPDRRHPAGPRSAAGRRHPPAAPTARSRGVVASVRAGPPVAEASPPAVRGRSRLAVHPDSGGGSARIRPRRRPSSRPARDGRSADRPPPRRRHRVRGRAHDRPLRQRGAAPARAGGPASTGCRSSPGRRRSRPRTAIDAYGRDGVRRPTPVSCGDSIAPIGPGYTDPYACPPVRSYTGHTLRQAEHRMHRSAGAPDRVGRAPRCARCPAAPGATSCGPSPGVTPVHIEVYGFIRSPVDERGSSCRNTSRSGRSAAASRCPSTVISVSRQGQAHPPVALGLHHHQRAGLGDREVRAGHRHPGGQELPPQVRAGPPRPAPAARR